MRVLRTDSQTSNEQKDGVQLDVMHAAAPGFHSRKYCTVWTTSGFVAMIQSTLWVDECLEETCNPMYFLSSFPKTQYTGNKDTVLYVQPCTVYSVTSAFRFDLR